MEKILEGDLAHFEVPDLLSLVKAGRRTGVLALERRDQESKLYFRAGNPVFAASTREDLRLGRLLVRQGKVPAEVIDEALEWQHSNGGRLGSALLAAADVCVLPSRWEPFGTVMLEAWAAGRPLVAAASQGPSALIEDGMNGLLVAIDDASALAAAVRRLAGDPVLKARLIAQGAADYQRGYTRETVTQRMIDLYREIIAGSTLGSAGERA